MSFIARLTFLSIVWIKLSSALICSTEEERIARDVTQGTPIFIDYVQDENGLIDLFEHLNYTDREARLPFFMNFNMFGIHGIATCGHLKYHVRGNISTKSIVLSGCKLLTKQRFVLTILSTSISAYIAESKNFTTGFQLCKNQSISNETMLTLRDCKNVSIDVEACVEHRKSESTLWIIGSVISTIAFVGFLIALLLLQKNGIRFCVRQDSSVPTIAT